MNRQTKHLVARFDPRHAASHLTFGKPLGVNGAGLVTAKTKRETVRQMIEA
jgi:hypothetical protein